MNESGLGSFGYRGWIYELAKTGMHGTVSEVERLNYIEFCSALDFVRAELKYQELYADS